MIIKQRDGAGEAEGYGEHHGYNENEEYTIFTNTGKATNTGGVRNGNAREDGRSLRRLLGISGKNMTPFTAGYGQITGRGNG